MVNIHMRYQWSRSSLLSRFTSITKITLKKKNNNKQVSLSLLCLRFIAIFCYLGQQSAPSAQSSAIFTEKWKTFQSRLTLGPTGPGSPSSPRKPGGPYILTKIFVSSVKGESKSKGGAGVREREGNRLRLLWPGLKSRRRRHFRNGKGTGDDMRPASVYGIVTRDALVSYWPFLSRSLVTVPEVFVKVHSVQFPCPTWVEFVLGSLPCSERFFSGYSGFPLSQKNLDFQIPIRSGTHGHV